jgi:hypothetical protein
MRPRATNNIMLQGIRPNVEGIASVNLDSLEMQGCIRRSSVQNSAMALEIIHRARLQRRGSKREGLRGVPSEGVQRPAHLEMPRLVLGAVNCLHSPPHVCFSAPASVGGVRMIVVSVCFQGLACISRVPCQFMTGVGAVGCRPPSGGKFAALLCAFLVITFDQS